MTDPKQASSVDFQELLAELKSANDALEGATDALIAERDTALQDMENEFAAAENAMTKAADWLEENSGSAE